MSVTASEVLRAVFDGCEGQVELRALPSRARAFAPVEDLRPLGAFVKAHRQENLYFGVAARRDTSSGELANCSDLGALYVDLDAKNGSEAAVRQALARCPLQPSILVHSGAGLHVYYLLKEPMPAAEAGPWLRRLQTALDGDRASAEPARVLRLPNTRNFKYQPPRPVVLEQFDPERRYALPDFDDWLPSDPQPERKRPPVEASVMLRRLGTAGLYVRPLNDRKHAVRCPWQAEHTVDSGDSETIVFEPSTPGGGFGFRCQHEHCAARGIGDLYRWLDLHERAAAQSRADDDAGGETRVEGDDDEATATRTSKRESQATKLVHLALDSGAEVWTTPEHDPHLTLPLPDHVEHYPLTARAVRDWLDLLYYKHEGRCAGREALKSALETLSGLARFEGEQHLAYLRVADLDDRLYVDLADAAWRAVEVTAAGWRIVTTAPVRFLRSATMLELPKPVPGGTLDPIRALLNLEDDASWRKIVGWWLQALRGKGPYPLLVLPSQQGTGKTTAAKILAATVDPDKGHPLGPPKEPRDLITAARHRYTLHFDNFSRIPEWLSDMLCRLSTGGAYVSRAYYTNADEHLLSVQRPVTINGIGALVTRPDLLDRSLVLALPVIADEDRLEEADLLAEAERLRPAILGALLDLLVVALGADRPLVHRLPRLADHALWVTRAEAALGWPSGVYLETLFEQRTTANVELLDADLLGSELRLFMEHARSWSGTSGELLAALNRRVAEQTTKSKEWPQTPEAIATGLARLAPSLRQVGILVTRARRTGRARPWRLDYTDPQGGD